MIGSAIDDDVGLLEAELADRPIALELAAVDLTGDEDGRLRVEVARADAGQQVGRARAARRERDPGNAGHRTGSACGERGGLLVVHAHDAGLAEPVERVE